MIKDRSRPQRLRLFRDERMEQLTLISPLGFATTWLVVLMLALVASWGRASVTVSLGLVLLGILIWTLFEYAMHRFLFHLTPKSQLGQWLIFLMHGNHHVDPGDRYRNIMPPIVSLWVIGGFWGVSVLLLGPVGSVLSLGFAIGYVVYDGIHYACHQFPMRSPVLRQLKRHHIRHHYAKQEGNYAITAIFWDRVFRTDVRVKGR
ncbi:MAG TPA: sterol desaturase family protein [Acetobacteraceae bacterium]|nr:sterol desaturase family protein [Acetobacteraceae bacterium]